MLERLRSAWARITSNPWLKLASFGVAMLTWWWVQNQEVTTARVPVRLEYELKEGLVSVDPLLSTATFLVSGPRALTRRASTAQATLRLDLRQVGVGPYETPLDGLAVEGFPAGLVIGPHSPEVVRLRLDEQRKRSVKVKVKLVGEPAEGHVVEGTISQEVVEIVGPRQVIDEVKALETQPIDVSGWTESRDVPVQLALPRQCTTSKEWNGVAHLEIQSTSTTVTLTDVEVFVRGHADWAPTPEHARISVRLTGPTSLLRALRPTRVFAVVDLPATPSGERYVATYEASKAPRLELMHPWPDQVRVAETPAPVTVVRRP
jgi:YbbR domain-containing protein